ncbi:hypothetical protein [Pseudomonas glycinae]|uniref:hypothetical protein n=1 Tax=Pseudomonas glycinae TaxID=1785145 RepID=UPI001F1DBCE8|nr:hypothetical protein [Pseudomonas glycinae]
MNQMTHDFSIQRGRKALLLRHQQIAAFIATTLIFLTLHKIMGVAVFPWDSGNYWKLSSIDNLLNFPKTIRGYFFPALLFPARYASDTFDALGYFPYRIITSVVYGYFFAILIPKFYLQLFGGQVSFGRRLITPLLVAVLFPGVIVYPLSDLPALALMVCASICVLSSTCTSGAFKRYALLVLSGILAYGAYNSRSIYLFPAGLLAIGLPFIIFVKSGVRIRVFATIAFLIGAAVASIPQVAINYKNENSLSPLLITTSLYNRSLFANQLLWGITLQRYETSIDKNSPGPEVFYLDRAGEKLFTKNNIGASAFELETYLRLVISNPLDFLGIYGRHIINGLDLRDGEVYTKTSLKNRDAFALLSFLVLFAGLLVIVINRTTNRPETDQQHSPLFWSLVLLLPVVAVIPGAVESRFFLAAHLSAYCALAYSSDFDAIKSLLRRHWLVVSMALIMSATLFFSISTATQADIQHTYPPLYRGQW